jgi:site-specific DNA-methyltransferase (adenine-specific)
MIEKYKNKIICGDALEKLKELPSESIDCVITSPPYFNLRDYGVDGQIGMEKTHQEYIKKLIDIFSEVKRILKKEGTCFVNLGDTYNSSPIGHQVDKLREKSYQFKKNQDKNISTKSLMLIPERFVIAMIDNGWILRNKLVWVKPNAMPESVQDRWKKAHEYIFFFVKSKKYFFNLDAIRTLHKDISIKRAEYEQGRNALGLNPSSMGEKYKKNKSAMYGMPARQVKLNPLGAVPPDYLVVNTNCSEQDTSLEHYATYPQRLIAPLIRAGCPGKGIVLDPFFGSGTTGLVAKKLGRSFVGIELSPEYIKIAEKRLSQNNLGI